MFTTRACGARRDGSELMESRLLGTRMPLPKEAPKGSGTEPAAQMGGILWIFVALGYNIDNIGQRVFSTKIPPLHLSSGDSSPPHSLFLDNSLHQFSIAATRQPPKI